MIQRWLAPLLVIVLAASLCLAQVHGAPPPSSTSSAGLAGSNIARGISPGLMSRLDARSLIKQNQDSPIAAPSGLVSALDLKAPAKARGEYDKGYVSLMRKDYFDAEDHLSNAISIYPAFVAAHNALGSAYLQVGQERMARDEFASAISLDDHLPNSYLNLGCAELALEDYASAVESVQKASALAPLDLEVAMTLSYAEFMNGDYTSVISGARQIHNRKHEGAAMVHYYAAAAWQRRQNLLEMRGELEKFLIEDPKSPRAEQAKQTLDDLVAHENADAALGSQGQNSQASGAHPPLTAEQAAIQQQLAKQDSREATQIAEAAAWDASNSAVKRREDESSRLVKDAPRQAQAASSSGNSFLLRSVVDEVGVMFTASEHGRAVPDLGRQDVTVLDSQKPPATITGFRSQSDLPLRLGIIIDTSESVTGQFSFEQRAAVRFLQSALTNGSDLAFVIGVANSVLLVQDFTNDKQQLAHAVNELAPGGGTALWDAVSFAAEKLGGRKETQPVARLLVVISDGKDNSSRSTLKEAIQSADLGEVFVYTLCTAGVGNTRDPLIEANSNLLGPHAMKLLAEESGGAALAPRSLRGLDSTLESVGERIRSRYLISYKPADFTADGAYHDIQISASKLGHKLRVYARRGYYARTSSAQ